MSTYSHFNNNYYTIREDYNSVTPSFNLFKDVYLLSTENDLLSKDALNIFY
jgi:hypothetical protein